MQHFPFHACIEKGTIQITHFKLSCSLSQHAHFPSRILVAAIHNLLIDATDGTDAVGATPAAPFAAFIPFRPHILVRAASSATGRSFICEVSCDPTKCCAISNASMSLLSQMPPDFGGYMTAAAAAAVSAGYGNGSAYSSSTAPQHTAYKRSAGAAGTHPYQGSASLPAVFPKSILYNNLTKLHFHASFNYFASEFRPWLNHG